MVRGKTAAWLAYGLLVLSLAFTLGYLLGSGKGETRISVTTVEAEPVEVTFVEEPSPIIQTPMNLNTATQSQLEQLPGIGPEMAKRILTYRAENTRFVTVEQLMDVEGIGEKRFEQLKPLVYVE